KNGSDFGFLIVSEVEFLREHLQMLIHAHRTVGVALAHMLMFVALCRLARLGPQRHRQRANCKQQNLSDLLHVRAAPLFRIFMNKLHPGITFPASNENTKCPTLLPVLVRSSYCEDAANLRSVGAKPA